MNEIVNNFLLAGDKFITEMHLNSPDLHRVLVDHLQKNKERIQKLKETEDSRYVYQNELDKACSQHDIANGDFQDLTRRTASDKILHDKAFDIAKNPKYGGYQKGLASIVYKFFDKKTSGGTVKNENISNKELAEKLHKPIIRKFKKRTVHSPYRDNIWGADIVDMQLINKFNKEFRFLLCLIDIYSKYVSVIPLKHKKGIAITNAFQKILNESNRKTKKIKNVYIDKLDDIVNKYNNTYHRTIKMKPLHVKSNTYINSSKETSDKRF